MPDSQVLDEISQACVSLLGVAPEHIEFPGGQKRKSVRVIANGQGFIVSRRRSKNRAQLEAGVLRELHKAGAPVPALIAHKGEWVVQEDLGDNRLNKALNSCEAARRETLLGAALESIQAYQLAAAKTGLDQRVVQIGKNRAGWIEDLVGLPEKMSEQYAIECPDYSVSGLAEKLKVANPGFIKWDARTGNAIVADDGRIRWFDWEHAGVRHPLDDVAWLLGDEYVPELESEAEHRLMLAACQMRGFHQSEIFYLLLFGVFHMTVRLSLILSSKGDGPWWDRDKTLELDRIGVTKDRAVVLAKRASHWCHLSPDVKHLEPFYVALVDYIERLE